MYITIVYFPGCDVINFGNNLIFLIKPFFYMTKKLRQNLNIFSTKRAFNVIFFIIFRGLSVSKYCLRPEGVPLTHRIFVAYPKNCSFECGLTTCLKKGLMRNNMHQTNTILASLQRSLLLHLTSQTDVTQKQIKFVPWNSLSQLRDFAWRNQPLFNFLIYFIQKKI